jgi:hypothetical protein
MSQGKYTMVGRSTITSAATVVAQCQIQDQQVWGQQTENPGLSESSDRG